MASVLPGRIATPSVLCVGIDRYYHKCGPLDIGEEKHLILRILLCNLCACVVPVCLTRGLPLPALSYGNLPTISL
jgi:hypothetical protein